MKRKGDFGGHSFKAKRKFKPVASVPAAVAMEVSRQLATTIERENIEIGPSAADANTTGAVVLLNGLASAGRGSKVLMKSIQMNGYCKPITGTGIAQMHRVVVVYDRQNNGGTPAITDIMRSAQAISMKNQLNDQRFLVLYDGLFAVASATDGNAVPVPFRFYKKLNQLINFSPTSTDAAAGITSGAIWLAVLGSEADDGSDGSVTYCSRVRYTDA